MKATLYPLGHEVRIASNSTHAIDIARDKWGEWKRRFEGQAIEFHIEVQAGPASRDPRYERFEDGFMLCGGEDRAGFSLERRSGWAKLSDETLTSDRFWWDYLQPLVVTALDWVYFLPIHAACLMRGRRSVLLCGDSGAGKSTLAYAGARAGWTFVSDDALHWSVADGVLVPGSNRISLREPARSLFPEIADTAAHCTDNGKLAIEVVPGNFACEAPLGPLVFLDRRPGGAELVPEHEETARAYCSGYCPRPNGDYGALLALGVCRLRYERIEDAVKMLERLV